MNDNVRFMLSWASVRAEQEIYRYRCCRPVTSRKLDSRIHTSCRVTSINTRITKRPQDVILQHGVRMGQIKTSYHIPVNSLINITSSFKKYFELFNSSSLKLIFPCFQVKHTDDHTVCMNIIPPPHVYLSLNTDTWICIYMCVCVCVCISGWRSSSEPSVPLCVSLDSITWAQWGWVRAVCREGRGRQSRRLCVQARRSGVTGARERAASLCTTGTHTHSFSVCVCVCVTWTHTHSSATSRCVSPCPSPSHRQKVWRLMQCKWGAVHRKNLRKREEAVKSERRKKRGEGGEAGRRPECVYKF